jgi:hypothetical protein
MKGQHSELADPGEKKNIASEINKKQEKHKSNHGGEESCSCRWISYVIKPDGTGGGYGGGGGGGDDCGDDDCSW